MKDFIMSLPLWFVMSFITAVTFFVIWKLAKADKIKAGPIEIEDNEDKEEVQK